MGRPTRFGAWRDVPDNHGAIIQISSTVAGTIRDVVNAFETTIVTFDALIHASKAVRGDLEAITGAPEAIGETSCGVAGALRGITEAFRGVHGRRARSVLRTLGAFSDATRAGRAWAARSRH